MVSFSPSLIDFNNSEEVLSRFSVGNQIRTHLRGICGSATRLSLIVRMEAVLRIKGQAPSCYGILWDFCTEINLIKLWQYFDCCAKNSLIIITFFILLVLFYCMRHVMSLVDYRYCVDVSYYIKSGECEV